MNKPCFYRRHPAAPVGYDEPTIEEITESLINIVTRVHDHDRELRLLRGRLRRLKVSVALLALSLISMSICRIWEAL